MSELKRINTYRAILRPMFLQGAVMLIMAGEYKNQHCHTKRGLNVYETKEDSGKTAHRHSLAGFNAVRA